VAALGAPVLVWRGGVLEEETIVFLRNYWGQHSILEKVFDPHANDFGTYQARELSYFVDFLDAQWLKALLGRGLDFFVPPSALAASALLVIAFGRGVQVALPGLDGLTARLALLVFLTNFVFVSTMGLFYRATKPLLAPVVLALVFLLLRASRDDRAPAPLLGAIFGIACAMSLLDRQGFFYLAVAATSLVVVFAWRRRAGAVALTLLGATGLGLLYNYALGPFLVRVINGYWPRFRYQRLALHKVADPQFYLQAGELLLGHAGTLFGGMPAGAVAALATVGLGVGLWWWRRGGRPLPTLGLLLALLVGTSQVVMFALMIMRYPQVHDWVDHRLWYYPLPFQVLALFTLLVVLGAVLPALGPRGRATVRIALVVVIAANVASWPRNKAAMTSGPWFSKTYAQSALFRASLREGRPETPLYGAYRDFYHECLDLFPALAARARPQARGGEGFYTSELREGRVFAWARQAARLVLTVQETGTFQVGGTLWLRPSEAVVFSPADGPPVRVESPAATEASVPFSLRLRLQAGKTDLPLRSEQPDREVGSAREPKAAAFGLFLPVTVETVSTRVHEVVGNVDDSTAPVHLGRFGQHPLHLSGQRDSQPAALPVVGPPPPPGRGNEAAAHLARSLPREHAPRKAVRAEVEVERHRRRRDAEGRTSGGVVDRRPDDALGRQERGRKPGRFGQVAMKGTRGDLGRALDIGEGHQAHYGGEHGTPAVHEGITDADADARCHAHPRVPHEAGGLGRDFLDRLEGGPAAFRRLREKPSFLP